MRIALLACLFLISGTMRVSDRDWSPSVAAVAPPPELQLTTTLVSDRYCKDEAGSSVMLNLELALRYTNAGARSQVVYKHTHTILREMISSNLERASSDQYDHDYSIFSVAAAPSSSKDFSTEDFVVLEPGSSFDAEDNTIVALSVAPSIPNTNGTLLPGNHYLRITVATWPESGASLEPLEKRWRGLGVVASKVATSAPMLIRVRDHPATDDCSPFADLFRAADTDANAHELDFTALMAAIYEGREDIFSELLKRGANVNAATRQGETALTMAALYHSNYVRQLLSHGADVNAPTTEGETALLRAMQKCDTESIDLLVRAGANLKAMDQRGCTPLMLLKQCKYKHDEIVRVLKNAQTSAGK